MVRPSDLESRQSGRPAVNARREMVRPSDLESRQSYYSRVHFFSADGPPLGFGIKAKHLNSCHRRPHGWSAPRIWNQGKAVPVLLFVIA